MCDGGRSAKGSWHDFSDSDVDNPWCYLLSVNKTFPIDDSGVGRGLCRLFFSWYLSEFFLG